MRMSLTSRLSIFISFLLLMMWGHASAQTYTSVASGPASTPATWTPALVPGDLTNPAATFIIAAGHIVTQDAPMNISSLNVQVGGTFNGGASALSTASNLTVAGTLTAGAGNITIGGATSITGTLTAGAGNAKFVGGVTINSGTLTAGTGFLEFDANLTISGTNGTFNGATASSITILGTLDMTTGITPTFTATSGITTLSGSFNFGGSFINNGGTFIYNGGAAQNVAGVNYQNLTITTNGGKNAMGNITVSGDLLISGSATLGLAGTTTNVIGNVSVSTAGASLVAITGPINIGGNLSSAGTFTAGNGVLDINGNVNITGGTFTASATTTTLAGDFVLSGGSFTAPALSTFTYDGAGNQIVAAVNYANLTLTGSGNKTAAAGTLAAANTTTVSGTANFQTGAATATFNALNISTAGAALTGGAGNLTVNGTFTNSGTFNGGSGTAAFVADVTSGAGSTFIASSGLTTFNASAGGTSITGSFNANGGTVGFVRAGNQTVPALNYFNLTLSGSGTKAAANALDIDGNLSLGNGITFNAGTFTHTIAGNYSEDTGASLGGLTHRLVFDGGGTSTISGTGPIDFRNVTVAANTNLTVSAGIATSFLELDLTAGNITVRFSESATTTFGTLLTPTVCVGSPNVVLRATNNGSPRATVNFNTASITGVNIFDIDASAALTLNGGTIGNTSNITATTGTIFYWVGKTGGNWNDPQMWSFASDGPPQGPGGCIPSSANDVVFDNGSFNGNGRIVTVTAGAECRNITWATTVTGTNQQLALGVNGLDIHGNIIFQTNPLNWSITGTAPLRMLSGTAQTILTTGEPIPNLTVNGTGSFTLLDALTVTNTLVLAQGTFVSDGYNISATQLNANSTTARQLNLSDGPGGTTTVTLSGTGNAFDLRGTTEATILSSANTAINFTNTGAVTMQIGAVAKTLPNVNFVNSTGAAVINSDAGGTMVFRSLTKTAPGGSLTINEANNFYDFLGAVNIASTLANPTTVNITTQGGGTFTHFRSNVTFGAGATGTFGGNQLQFYGPINFGVGSNITFNSNNHDFNAGATFLLQSTPANPSTVTFANTNDSDIFFTEAFTAQQNAIINVGRAITFASTFSAGNNSTVNLGTNADAGGGTNANFNAQVTMGTGSLVNLQRGNATFAGAAANTFHNIQVGSGAVFRLNNTAASTINDITLANNATMRFRGGQTATVNALITPTSCSDLVIINSSNPGTPANVTFPAPQLINRANITDISATPSISVFDGTNGGGNTNVFYPGSASLTPRTLYWVGGNVTAGTGNWNDCNNWAATSGGVGGLAQPNATDNVIFDVNSFNGTGPSAVNVTANAMANNVTWTGAIANNPVLTLVTNHLSIHGNLDVQASLPAANWDITATTGEIRMVGTAARTIRTNGEPIPNLRFNGTGGTWVPQDALTVDAALIIETGHLNNSGNVALSTGTLDVQAAGQLSGGSATFTITGATATFANAATTALSNTILNFTTAATRTLTLGNTTDRTIGTVNVATGTLTVANSTAPSQTFTNVTVQAGATFVNNIATGTSIGNISGAGNLTFNGTGTSAVTGTVNLTGGTFTVTGAASTITFSGTANNTFNNFAVTNPATVLFTNAGTETFANVTLGTGAGYVWRFSAGITSTVTGVFSTPLCITVFDNITVTSSVVATPATVNFTQPQAWFSVAMRDIHVTGGPLNVNYATDNGGNATLGTTLNLNTSGAATIVYYWIGDTGNWSDPTKWSFTSGGPAQGIGGCFPTQNDDAIFDVNSFSGNGRTVTVDIPNAACRSLFWRADQENTGITFALGANNLDIHANLDLQTPPANWAITSTTAAIRMVGSGNFTIRTNAEPLPELRFNNVNGTWTLEDALTVTRAIFLEAGHFRTGTAATAGNFFSVTAERFNTNFGNSRTLTLWNSMFLLTGNGNLTLDLRGGSGPTALVLNSDNSSSFELNNTGGFVQLHLGGGVSTRTMPNLIFRNPGPRDIDILAGDSPSNTLTFRDVRILDPNLASQFYIANNVNKLFTGIVEIAANKTGGDSYTGTGGNRNRIEGPATYDSDVIVGPSCNINFVNSHTFNGTVAFGTTNGLLFNRTNTTSTVIFNHSVAPVPSAPPTLPSFSPPLPAPPILIDPTDTQYYPTTVSARFGEGSTISFSLPLIQNTDMYFQGDEGPLNPVPLTLPRGAVNFNQAVTGASGRLITFGEVLEVQMNATGTKSFSNVFTNKGTTIITSSNVSLENFRLSRFNIVRLNQGSIFSVTGAQNPTNGMGGFTARVNCDSWLIVESRTPGTQAIINFNGVATRWENVLVRDINATPTSLQNDSGGNLGNNDSIAFPSQRAAQNFFWIGNAGQNDPNTGSSNQHWSNPNNWALSSGGMSGSQGCIPNPIDDVFFDVNSFSSDVHQVVIDIPVVYCRNMEWVDASTTSPHTPMSHIGILNSPLAPNFTLNTPRIQIYKNLTGGERWQNDFRGIFEFVSDDAVVANIAHKPNAQGANENAFEGPIIFRAIGGSIANRQWNLTTNLNINGGTNGDLIIMNGGQLNAGSHTISLQGDWNIAAAARFNAGTGTVVFDGGRSNGDAVDDNYHQTVTLGTSNATTNTFYDFVVNRVSANNAARTVRLNNQIWINNHLTLTRGWLWDQGNQIHGNATGVFSMTNEATIEVGNVIASVFPTDFANDKINFGRTSSFRYRGNRSTNQNVRILSSATPERTYGNLVFLNQGNDNTIDAIITADTDDRFGRKNLIASATDDGNTRLRYRGTLTIQNNAILNDNGIQINAWNSGGAPGFSMTNNARFNIGSSDAATEFPNGDLNNTGVNIQNNNNVIRYISGQPNQVVRALDGAGGDNRSYQNLVIRKTTGGSAVAGTVAKTITAPPNPPTNPTPTSLRVRRTLIIETDNDLRDNGLQINIDNDVAILDQFTMQANSFLTLGSATVSTIFPNVADNADINLDPTSTVVYNAGNTLTQTVRRLSSATANQNYGNLIIRNSSGTPALLNTVKQVGTQVTADATNQFTLRGDLTVEGFNDFQDNGYQIRRLASGGLLTVQNDAILTIGNNLTANARLGRTQLPLNFPRVNTTNISLAPNSTVIYNAGDAVAPDEGSVAPSPANNQIVAGNATGDGLIYGNLTLRNGNGAAAAYAHKFAGGRVDVRGNLTIENFALFGDSGWQITGSTTPANGITINGNGILELGMWNGFYNDVAGTTGGGWYGSFGNNQGGPDNTRPSVFPTNLSAAGKYTLAPGTTVRYIAHGHQRVTGNMTYQNLELLNPNACGGAYNCARYRDLVDGPIVINGNLLIDDNIWFRDNSHQISFTGVASTLTMDPNRSKLILGGTLPNASSPGGYNAVPNPPAGDYHQNWNATDAPTTILGNPVVATTFPTGIVNLNLNVNSYVIYNATVDQPIAALNSAAPAAQYGHLWLTKGQDPVAAPMVNKTLAGPATVRSSIWVYEQNNLVDGGHQITHSAAGEYRMEASSQATFGNGAAASTFPLNTVNANVNLNANSIIVYQATAAQNIRRLSSDSHTTNPQRNYANLVLRNNSAKSLAATPGVSATDFTNDCYVRGVLTLDNSTLVLNDQQLTMAGTFERVNDNANEVLRGGNNSDLRILGTGNLAAGALAKNALFFDMTTPGTTNQVRRFRLDRTTTGIATLGTDFVTGTNPGFNGEVRLINGELVLNSKHWIINTNGSAVFENSTTSSITGDFGAIITINGTGNFNTGDPATGRLRFTTGSSNLLRLSVNRTLAGDDNVWIGTDLTIGDPAVNPSTVATFPVNAASSGLELAAGDLIMPAGITFTLNSNHWRGTGRLASFSPGANLTIAKAPAFNASNATLQPLVFDHNPSVHMLATFTINTNDPVTMGSDLVVNTNLNLQHPNSLLILPTVANYVAQTPATIATGEGPRVLRLNGTLSGPGSFRGSYESRMFIGGTGDLLGDLKFENNTTANRLERLTIDRTAGGIVTIDASNDLTIGAPDLNTNDVLNAGEFNGLLSMQTGIFELNGRTLTLNSRQYQYLRSNGFFRGSPTSNLILNGPGNLGGTLNFTGTFANGGQVLNNLVINRSINGGDGTSLTNNTNVTAVTAGMGTTNLRVDGDLHLQRGSLVLSANTANVFNINGTLTRADADPTVRYVPAEGGLIRGNSNSNLTIGNGNASVVNLYLDDSDPGRRRLRDLRIERVAAGTPAAPHATILRTELGINRELRIATGATLDMEVNKTDTDASDDGDGGYKGLLLSANNCLIDAAGFQGTISGSYLSDIYVNSNSGNVGTLRMQDGANMLRALIFEQGNGNHVNMAITLGTDLIVGAPIGVADVSRGQAELNGRMNFQLSGNLILNGRSLTFNSRNAQQAVHPHTGLTMTGSGRFTGDNAADITFQGSGNLGDPVIFATGAQVLQNLTIDRLEVAGNDNVLLGTDLTMHSSGTLALNDGDLSINGNLLTINGIHTNADGRFTGSTASRMLIGGAGVFAPLVFEQTSGATRTLADLEITRTSQPIQLATGNDLVLGLNASPLGLDLNGANVVFDLNGNALTINGDLAERTGRIRGSATSRLVLGGSGNVTGTLKFGPLAADQLLGNLTMNRAGNATLGTPLNLTGVNALSLSNGLLVTSTTNILSMDETATVTGGSANIGGGLSGGSNASFVNGPMRKAFAGAMGPTDAFRFPIGKGGQHLPAGLAGVNAASEFQAEYFRAPGPNQTSIPVSVTHISTLEHWDISRTSGIASANVILHYNTASEPGLTVLDREELRVMHNTGGAWADMGKQTTPALRDIATLASGWVVAPTANTTFSPFTWGNGGAANNPLPVTVTEFNARFEKGTGVLLDWRTATETENAGFILSRSIGNASRFTEIASYQTDRELVGVGNSDRPTRYRFTDNQDLEPGSLHYYQLEQVDLSGRVTNHGVRVVAVGATTTLYQNYPNPANDVTTFRFSIEAPGMTRFELIDILGRPVKVFVNEQLRPGTYEYEYSVHDLPSGIYIARLLTGEESLKVNVSVVK